MSEGRKIKPNNGAVDKSQTFFIIGTIGELTVEKCPDGKFKYTFELIPDEEMKTMRNGKDGYLWLPGDVDANGVGKAITRYGKVANIDFTKNCSRFLRLLIAAKVNAMKIRVVAENVMLDESVASCKCKCPGHPEKCTHANDDQYPHACAISLM